MLKIWLKVDWKNTAFTYFESIINKNEVITHDETSSAFTIINLTDNIFDNSENQDSRTKKTVYVRVHSKCLVVTTCTTSAAAKSGYKIFF